MRAASEMSEGSDDGAGATWLAREVDLCGGRDGGGAAVVVRWNLTRLDVVAVMVVIWAREPVGIEGLMQNYKYKEEEEMTAVTPAV